MTKREICYLIILFVVFISASTLKTNGINVENSTLLNGNLIGYRLNLNDEQPMKIDSEASFNIILDNFQEKKVWIFFYSRFGDFIFDNFELSIKNYLYQGKIQKFDLYIENSSMGFFAEIHHQANYLRIDFAFEKNESQFSFMGLSQSNNLEGFCSIFNQLSPNKEQVLCKKKSINLDLNQIKLLSKKESENFINSINFHRFNDLNHDLSKGGNTQLIKQKPRVSGYTITKDMIIHQSGGTAEIVNDDFPINIVNYMESNPNVDIEVGIARIGPSESQIKSDLQYYNKDTEYCYSIRSIRDIVAYEWFGHGGSNREWIIQQETYDYNIGWYEWQEVGRIYPSEITSLWGDSSSGNYNYHVFMDNAIILTFACQNWGTTLSTNPIMGSAFVDDGYASSWVGFTIDLPQDITDDCSEAFWYEFCSIGKNVEDATIALCDISTIFSYGVNCGIYGSISQTL
ncbi:MAG: hypothetical protein K9W44_14725 [Candidatus Lokiarchaeota archaeon]|nr:hypothetical protein [Candidatus Harpocratesius repetitus]